MKTKNPNRLAILLATPLVLASGASAAVRYVNVNSATPAPPYTNWATAAVTIQQAVDAATPGDEIVVTNGVYATGGRAVHGTMTNRVAVDKPLSLRSVNGPQLTIIQGYQVPVVTNGDGAIRCVYLTNGAVLVGFTLTNGATRIAGSADHDWSAGGVCCESATSVVSNCVMSGNSAISGGGAYRGTLHNCSLTGNAALGSGGGAAQATLTNCTLTGNSAGGYGGGTEGSTLHNCTLAGNSANAGGGATFSRLHNCTLTANRATATGPWEGGGGAYDSELNNCIVYFNSAPGGANYRYGTLTAGPEHGARGGHPGHARTARSISEPAEVDLERRSVAGRQRPLRLQRATSRR